MTEGIEIGVGFQVLDTAFKIFFVCGGLLPSFEEDRIVGIFSVYEMDGTDDEVKGIGKDQVMMFFCEVWLKSQFNADPEINPVCKLFLKRKQLLEINFRVQIQNRDHRPYNHSPYDLSGTDGSDRERARAQS